MQKQAPTLGRLATMVAFALSCFCLALFLWLAFGGSVPFKPKGYEFKAGIPESTQLADESDVRISGVSVGKVKDIQSSSTGRAIVTIELDHKYAPIRMDSRAMLRQKTLLGETYVELTPGSPNAKPLPDGGTLPFRNVQSTVQLDEIFRSFDEPTREAFRTWMQSQDKALKGRGIEINDAFGTLPGFADSANQLLAILNKQQGQVTSLIKNTGAVFAALSARRGQLRDLIVNSDRVFKTIARRDQQLADTFVAFPTFERESRATLQRLDQFAADTNPLIDQLRPAAREMSPTLQQINKFAPEFDGFMRALGPLVTASKAGMPALRKFLDQFRPVLQRIDPTFQNLNPFLDFIGQYPRELQALIGNVAGATEATSQAPAQIANPHNPGALHVVRALSPLNPQILAAYPRPLKISRSNPYALPNAFDELGKGLASYNASLCTSGIPTPGITSSGPYLPKDFYGLIQTYVYGGFAPDKLPAVPCRQQGKMTFGGFTGQYPHVSAAPLLPGEQAAQQSDR